MDEAQKSHLRLSCIFEASKLKQNRITSKEYKNKDLIEIAREIEKFVFLE